MYIVRNTAFSENHIFVRKKLLCDHLILFFSVYFLYRSKQNHLLFTLNSKQIVNLTSVEKIYCKTQVRADTRHFFS